MSPEHAKNHPYVEQLSTLRMLTTSWNAVNIETFPFLIDDSARLVAYYLDLYWEGSLTVHFSDLPELPSTVPAQDISNDRCRILFDRLFHENTGIPEYATNSVQQEIADLDVLIETISAAEGPESELLPELYDKRESLDPSCATVRASHFHRSACVRLLFERVTFLPQLQRKVMKDFLSDFGDILTSDVLQNPSCSYGYFAFLMSLFIRESATLSDNSLQQNWSNINTPFTARYASADSTQLYILCMSAKSDAEKDSQSRNSMCGVSGAALRASPGFLRLHFAPAFGISDSGRLLTILKSQSYVLTPDFAVKMHVLFEKRRTKAPTILRGETGTGKTELLNMLSLLSNADSRLFPDLAFELRKVLQALVEGGLLTHTEASHRVLFMKNDDESPRMRRITIPASDGSPAVTKEVGELWGSEDPQKLLNGILQILEEENDELVAQLTPLFLRQFRSVLQQYPLLKRSDWVNSVLHRDSLHHNPATALDDEEERDIDDDEDKEDDPTPTRSRGAISNARELIDFIRDVVTASPKNLFHCIRMHEGIKADEFRELVLAIKQQAEEAQHISLQLGIPIELVAFIDELNTTSIMGMVKEVFMDHMLDGVPLPDNIFWVAAINPSNTVADSSPRAGASNFTGVKSDSQELRYIVNDMPKSLEPAVMEYSSLTTDQERDWIGNYLNDTNLGLATELQNDENKNYIISALRAGIIASQEFVRNARMERVEVSIRDMVRAVQLYRFLLLPENRETFLPAVQGEATRDTHLIDRERCWKALMVSLGLVYYFRLDTSRDLRSQYLIMLMQLFERDGLEGRGSVSAHRELSESLPFAIVLSQSIDKLWNSTKRPRGIAPTRGLKENIFATVICVEACIPLIITGPPGTGKTLSFQIASRNMKGISSPTPSYKKLKLVQPFTYQCSQQSTASEIKDVYEAALARRQRFLRAGITSERCVVFMDEAGLPSERRAALKSIHYYTDHAQVASVMLTNQTLDTAKTNRAVQLLQSETTRDDLTALALESLFDFDVTDEVDQKLGMSQDIKDGVDQKTGLPRAVKDQVIGLCEAYSEAKCFCDIPGHPDAYHLRDFIYLCRFIRHCESQSVGRISPRAGQYSLFSAVTLLHALRRTFNGISDANFRSLALMFITKVNLLDDAIASFGSVTGTRRDDMGENLHLILGSDVMSSLRDALHDQLKPDEDPNQSHFRHIMLIDNSSSENAIALLFDLNVLDKQTTEVFEVSDFPDDTSDLQRSALISRIKTAVETGKTILLVNSHSIITAFFDLVNKHYMPVGTRSKGLSTATESSPDSVESEEVTQEVYYANISMGSFSRPCVVHPKTKIIVHIPVSQIPFTPLPFLNRFDKFRISVIDALNETLEGLVKVEAKENQNVAADYYPLSKLYRHIHDGVEDFVRTVNGKTMMYGLVERETVAALILRSIQDTVSINNFTFPVIRRCFHVDLTARHEQNHSFLVEDEENAMEISHHEEGDGEEHYQDRLRAAVSVVKNIRKFVRDINLQLLQYARPEHVFLARGVLPTAYIREYLRQEHFSASNLIRFFVKKHWLRPLSLEPLNIGDASGHKFIIFVRTSAELYRLKQSAELQRQLLPPSDASSSSIRIIHLGSYTSATKCMNDIGRFVEVESHRLDNLHRRLLIVVADRSIVSTSQVNITIRKIDQMLSLYQSKESLPLIIILQHFASESLQFGATYDSLPFNGWDMQYCDSFQLEDVADDRDIIVKREEVYGAIESKEPEPVTYAKEVQGVAIGTRVHNFNDSRRWMQVAFGLEKVPSPSDAVAEFQQAFFRELQISLSSTTGPREDAVRWKALQARGIEQSLALYANKPNKVASVLKIFRDRGYLIEALLRRFTSAWSSELVGTVTEAAVELITGKSLESMLEKIRGSFQILLRAYCRFSILAVATNYGFEAISNMPTDIELAESEDGDGKIRAKCAVLLLEGLKMPAAEELRRLGTASSTVLGCEFKYPPRIPMFNELMNQVRKLRAAVVAQVVGEKDCIDDILTRMREFLPKCKTLNRAIECIATSPRLWDDIVHDKICCSCGIDGIATNELTTVTTFINISLGNRRDVLRLLVDNSALEIAIQVVNILQPIRRLSSTDHPTNEFFLLDLAIENLDEGDGDINRPRCALQIRVVSYLWQRGLEVFTSDIDSLKSWVNAVRELSCNAVESFHRTAESPEFGYSGAMCVSVFKFLLQALSAGCAVPAIRDRIVDLFRLDVSSQELVTSLFSQLLSIIPEFASSLNSSDRVPSLVCQTEELVSWFTGARFTAASVSDVRVILAGLGSDAVGTNALQSIPVLVQIRWLVNMLDSPVDGLLLGINDELHRRDVRPEIFIPQNISTAVSHFQSRRDGLANVAPQRPALDCTLSVLVFQALLEQYRASRISFNMEELLRIFENDIKRRFHANALNALKISALAVHIAEVAAIQWIEGGNSQAFVESLSDRLLGVFGFMNGLKEYFFMSLRSESAMVKFFSNKDRLRRFHLDDSWYVHPIESDDRGGGTASTSRDQIYGWMPFMVIQTHELYGAYNALAAIVRSELPEANHQLHQWVQEQVSLNRKFFARMMIFLAAFHECFMTGKPCQCVLQFLRSPASLALLNITSVEANAYDRIASGPCEDALTADDGIKYLFSADSMRDKGVWMVSRRNCAVNAMSLILGSPPEKSYYYTVCFDNRVMQSHGLGSGYGLYSKDCGYQVELDSFRDIGTQKVVAFRNIRRYRALNNYVVWIAYAWGHWIRDDKTSCEWAVTYRERFNTHGLQGNFAAQEQERMQQLSPWQQTAINMVSRAHAFLGFLDTDNDLVGRGADPMLFTTLALFETIQHIGTSNVVAAFFAQNDSSLPVITATMNFLIDICWEPVYASVVETARLYDQRSQCEKMITILLEAYKIGFVEAIPVSFPNRNSAEQALSRLVTNESNATTSTVSTLTSTAAKYVSDFVLFSSNFEMGKYLHFLVFVYNWLQYRMAYRFTVDDSLELTAWQAVDRLEEATEKEQGRRLLNEFQEAWNEMRNAFQTYLDCAHAQMLGESDIPHVDVKQIRIGELLSQDSRDVVDLINRMLDGRLVRQQNDHLSSDHLRRLLQIGDFNSDALQSINHMGCLSDELPEELDVRFLPRDRSAMPLATIALSKSDQKELEEYIMSHTRTEAVTLQADGESSVEFRTEVDAVAIARFIVMRFTAGRRLLRMDRLRTPFLRRSEDLANFAMDVSSSAGESDELQQQVTATQRKPHQHLCGVAKELEKFWWRRTEGCEDDLVRTDLEDTLSGISNEEIKRMDTQLAKCTEAVGGDILLYLSTAVELARNQTPEIGEYEGLDAWLRLKISSLQVDDVCKTNEARTLVTIIKLLRIVALPAICSRIVEWWDGQEFLFSDLGREFSQMLDDGLVRQFHEIVAISMAGTRDDVSNSLEVLQAVAETMLRDEFRRNVRLFGAYKAMSDVFRDELNLPKGPMCDGISEFLRSRQLEARHYAHFMRLVRGACGDMSLYLRTMSSATVSSSSSSEQPVGTVGYLEKVPEEFAIFQEILDFSAPVDTRGAIHIGDEDDLGIAGFTSPDGISDWEDLGRESPIEIRLIPNHSEPPIELQQAPTMLKTSEESSSSSQLSNDWVDISGVAKSDLEMNTAEPPLPPPPPQPQPPLPPPVNESDASPPQKVAPNKLKANKVLSVEKFATQACMSVEDIEFLRMEGLISSKVLPGVGVRLPESSLSLLDSLLVELVDKAVSSDRVRILEARVMQRNQEDCITVRDWDRIQSYLRPKDLSAAELAVRLQVRVDDLQYLHREGLLVLRYEGTGETLEAGVEVDMSRCRADEVAVGNMINGLQGALASEDDVQTLQECVDMVDSQLEEALRLFGHQRIQYQGVHRVLTRGRRFLMDSFGLVDEEMEVDV